MTATIIINTQQQGPIEFDVLFVHSYFQQVGDGKLAILQAYAQKFLDDDVTKEDAQQCIEQHNARFNEGGDFLKGDDSRTLLFFPKKCFL